MSGDILSSLFSTLSVQVQAFAYCEIQAGWQLAKNGMTDAILVHYVLAGSGTIAVEGQEPLCFGPNHMVIPPRARRHAIGFAGATRTVTAEDARRVFPDGLIALTAGDGSRDILLACGSISARYAGALGLFDRLHEPLIEDLSGNGQLRHAFAFMVEELVRPSLGTQEVTSALMKQCLAILLRIHLQERGAQSPIFEALRDPRLVPAIAAVLDAPGAPHTVESLAALCGMSRSGFAERFSATFGEGPIEYLQRARLRLAAKLLTSSPMSVKVISESIGYASRSYFSHTFKATYGCDPSAYRVRAANLARELEPPSDLGGAIAWRNPEEP
ncbi:MULTISPECIES: AraC family transcriptional regulator [unclassified Methylobacterium]|uniref:helix-turn-helix transcriptional regulator n=1 Tax=unclassified Methylobacterium TaxID=2615210 RepID=UPI000372C9E9|nr:MULTISPECIES: AraC family transcriptional regulator [unclassified Methylobacterium]SEG66511.1 AraC-type DNA-binding protein [Methylobacterium sp. 190mf]